MGTSGHHRYSIEAEILAHYDAYDEAGRLSRSVGPLERERTRHLISRFIGEPPATVLDVGGGAGAYGLWLADQGYEVHLSDPVPKHVAQAEAAQSGSARFASVRVGDARDLHHRDSTADVVLSFGPLYHLTERSERLRSLEEAHRVLRPGGVLLAAAISRFGAVVSALRGGAWEDDAFLPILDRNLVDGQHRNTTGNPRYFTTAFFHRPDGLRRELLDAGFGSVEVLAIEGVGGVLGDVEDRWSDTRYRETLMELVRKTESEDSLIGASSHLMAIGIR